MDAINTYTFDFRAEADDMARGLPPGAPPILFTEVDVDGSQVRVGYTTGNRDGGLTEAARGVITQHFEKNPGHSSQSMKIGAAAVIALRTREQMSGILGPQDEDLMRLFALYHETGHTLMTEGPAIDKTHPYREAAADAFAALLFLKRFGAEAVPAISMLGWRRAFHAVGGGTNHFSTIVLDKIIADAPSRDFSTMSLQEAVAAARDYAADWTPDAAQLTAAIPDFTQSGNVNLDLLENTALSSPNDLAFYIGAKVFQPFLHPDGITVDGAAVRLSAETRLALTDLIDEDMPDDGLSRLFGRVAEKADPPLIEAVRVVRPKGQKPPAVRL